MLKFTSTNDKGTIFILLALVILGGMSLRLYGISWGFPYDFHFDEHIFVGEKLIELEWSILVKHRPHLGHFSAYGGLFYYIALPIKWILFNPLDLKLSTTFGDFMAANYSQVPVEGKIYFPHIILLAYALKIDKACRDG